MTEKTAKLIFWVGTLSSLALFLALTVDTHRQFAALTHADRLDQKVVAGKRAFEKYNCNDCHTILGFGGYYAPDLTRVHSRLGEDAIRRRLAHPEVAFADSYRKMPQQGLSEQEIEDIVAFFEWVSAIDNHDWPPQHSEAKWKRSTERLLAGAVMSPAAALVNQEDCLTCHALGDQGEKAGGRLEWIGARRNASWIAEYLADPEAVSPGAEMPAYDHLSAGQRQMVGEFIVSLAANTDGR
jgi:nitric oxide reductase subunit C